MRRPERVLTCGIGSTQGRSYYIASRPLQSDEGFGIKFETAYPVDTAHIGKRAPWFEFKLGPVPRGNPHIESIGITKKWKPAIDLKFQFPSNTIMFGGNVSFACTDCGSAGRLMATVEASKWHPVPKLSFSMTDHVGFWANMEVGFWKSMDDPLEEWTQHVATLPIVGLHIPYLLTIGPSMEVDAVLQLSAPTAGGSVLLVSHRISLSFHLCFFFFFFAADT